MSQCVEYYYSWKKKRKFDHGRAHVVDKKPRRDKEEVQEAEEKVDELGLGARLLLLLFWGEKGLFVCQGLESAWCWASSPAPRPQRRRCRSPCPNFFPVPPGFQPTNMLFSFWGYLESFQANIFN